MLILQTPTSTLFPYTTLFRSAFRATAGEPPVVSPARSGGLRAQRGKILRRCRRLASRHAAPRGRSEEHTSELQSHVNLVCRLLLEKKNLLPCWSDWSSYYHFN